MNPQISNGTFDTFFAWAPGVIGIVIYLAFYIAKRGENAPVAATATGPSTPTYACAQCGRVGAIEQMVPQDRGGAVTYACAHCSQAP